MADDVASAPTPLSAMEGAIDPSASASAPATSGTVTPAVELTAAERRQSLNVTLADKVARAGALWAQGAYEEAAEAYAQAAEMQAEINGDMCPDNAEVLFLYGRALFRVGQANSDVLGGKAPAPAAAPGRNARKGRKEKAAGGEEPAGEDRIADEAGEAKTQDEAADKKPLFQFTGDENFEDSDEEDAEGESEDESDDDLEVAFEILDLARILFNKRLEAAHAEAPDAKGKEASKDDSPKDDSPEIKHIKERLADTHGLLAEISLENERYSHAITDARASLKYKQELYPDDSGAVAEAHFKLSLALEFASVTTPEEEEGAAEKAAGPKPMDQGMRDEAVKEMEAAIACTKLQLQTKEVELATLHSPEDNEATRKRIADVKDLIADMEQRLVDLKNPPIDMEAVLHGSGSNPLGGILGAALGGGSSAEAQSRIEAAKMTATDLTGLVRKKNLKAEPAAADANGKRKADEPAEGTTPPADPKKAKVDDAADA